ncbi:MAG: hypothetical protein WEB09_07660 [Nitriliruptor sp.]
MGATSFPVRVRRRRLALRLTQRVAAQRAGVSLATWQSLERVGAEADSFQDLTLARVAHGLEIELEALLRDGDGAVGGPDVARGDDGAAAPEELIELLDERLRRLAEVSEETFLLVHGQALEAAERFLEVFDR